MCSSCRSTIQIEPGIGGSSANLLDRLAGFRRDNSPRAKALKQQARRWAGNAEATGDPAILLAKAWPGQIARRRDGSQTSYLLANGRAGELAADSALAKAQWIVVADMVGAAGRARTSKKSRNRFKKDMRFKYMWILSDFQIFFLLDLIFITSMFFS